MEQTREQMREKRALDEVSHSPKEGMKRDTPLLEADSLRLIRFIYVSLAGSSYTDKMKPALCMPLVQESTGCKEM